MWISIGINEGDFELGKSKMNERLDELLVIVRSFEETCWVAGPVDTVNCVD